MATYLVYTNQGKLQVNPATEVARLQHSDSMMPRQGTSSDRVKPCTGFEPSKEANTTHTVNLYSQEKLRLQVMIPKPLCNVINTTEPTKRESWLQGISVQSTDIQTLGAKCQGVGFHFVISQPMHGGDLSMCPS